MATALEVIGGVVVVAYFLSIAIPLHAGAVQFWIYVWKNAGKWFGSRKKEMEERDEKFERGSRKGETG